MGCPISTMIGIRTGGVLSGSTDMDDLKKRIINTIEQIEEEEYCDINSENLEYCLSHELSATKGSYVVIAGVFNYWNYDSTSKFAKRLSKECDVEVMVMTWDEENDNAKCNIFLDGKELSETKENIIKTTLRRCT